MTNDEIIRMCAQNASPFGYAGYFVDAAANAFRTPRQLKLDAAREYLKSKAWAHPEWTVRRITE